MEVFFGIVTLALAIPCAYSTARMLRILIWGVPREK